MNDETSPDQNSAPEQPPASAPQVDSPPPPSAEKFSLGKVLADAQAVLTGPAVFYRSMSTSGGYAEPAIFVAVMGAAMGLLISLFSLFGASAIGSMAVGLGAVIIMPIFAVIGSFIAALVMFVIWKLMGSEQNYEGAYRSVAYSTSLYPVMAVVGLIPYLGTIIGVVWGAYLMFTATTEVHKIARQKAKIVFAVLGILMLFMQISSEIATRQLQAKVEEMGASAEDVGKAMERFGKSMEAYQGDNEELSPEEAGKAVGDFLRGMSEAIEKSEAGAKEKEGE